jgi:hypothetical protein
MRNIDIDSTESPVYGVTYAVEAKRWIASTTKLNIKL